MLSTGQMLLLPWVTVNTRLIFKLETEALWDS
jgi:hypothetical protein